MKQNIERFIGSIIRNPERGFALLVVLMVMILMSALGTGFIMSTSMERQLAQTEQDGIVASYMSESGIAWAMNQIRNAAWLEDIDEDDNMLFTAFDSVTGKFTELGHFIHDTVNYPAIYPTPTWPRQACHVDKISDDQFGGKFGPNDTGFRVWAELPSPYGNVWHLVSIGFSNKTSTTTRVIFRTLPMSTKFALSAEEIIEMGTFRLNDFGAIPYAMVDGGIWSNGELHIDAGTQITLQASGTDGISGKNPVTGVNDDEYIAAIGHITVGGIVGTMDDPVKMYASSADTFGLDDYGPGLATRPNNIGIMGRGGVNGELYLRDGFERTGLDPFTGQTQWDYATVWGGRHWGVNQRLYSMCYFRVPHPQTHPVTGANQACPNANPNPAWADGRYLHPFIRIVPTPTPTVAGTPAGTFTPLPTATPTPTGPTATPTFEPPNPINVYSESLCGQMVFWYRPTAVPIPSSTCVVRTCHWQGNNPEFYRDYCAKAETMPGSSDVLGCSSLENSPYREHEMFAMFDMYYPPPSGPHPDNWFVQQHPGNYANNDGILLKREFGASQFDKLDSSGENFYVILAKGSGETQTTDGTLFQHWTDFDDYVNERNGNMDLVWQPGEHPSLGTQYPDAVVIGSTLGTLFFILDDGYGFPGIDHDLIVLGGIMTTGGIDIRDYGSRVRLSTDDNRVYDWWAGRVATWYDQETSPLPPAGFTYEPDGVRHLYVFQPNTTLPALACAKDLLIVNRAYSTVIAGWPSASGTFVYSKERILWYNPIPTDRSQYKVRVTGAMHAKYMYLYGSFAIAYEPTVQNQQMMTETVPDSIEIIEVQKGVQLDEAYYKGLADAT